MNATTTTTATGSESETVPGCRVLTAAAVQQLDAIARDPDAMYSLGRACELALAAVNREVQDERRLFHAESTESHLWHLLRLARLIAILDAPGVVGRQPHIEHGRG